MNAPLERGCFGSFPSLPWKGKSSKSMLTRSREGTGAACHLGVRSLTGALGLPQNRASLEDGDLEALQKDHSQADRPQWHRVCINVHVCTHARKTQDFIFTTQVGRKRRLLLLRNFGPGSPPFYWHQKTIFKEQTGFLVSYEVS